MTRIGKTLGRIHNPPLERLEVCDEHGEYIASCFIGDAWTNCPACRAFADAKQEIEAERREQAKRITAWQRAIGEACIPERFRACTFDAYRITTDAQRQVVERAREYVEHFDEHRGKSLIFVGSTGTGKTHLAVAIALQLIRRGKSALYTTVTRAVMRVKDTWRRESKKTESEALAELVFPDLLILDELGVQLRTRSERVVLFEIVNQRYEQLKSMIFISNLSEDAAMAALDERIVDRLREDGAECLAFDWPSHRKTPQAPQDCNSTNTK
jgi:DNA replication protein DnaC